MLTRRDNYLDTHRNEAAQQIHNFVTRDGTAPLEFRAIARDQLAAYPGVELRDEPVRAIEGARGAFRVALSSGTAHARRVLLCTGMIDEMIPIDGFAELWGRAIVQCPYCHGWEGRGRRWGYLAQDASRLDFAVLLHGWTQDVVVFTGGAFAVPTDACARLDAAGIRLEVRPIARLVGGHSEPAAVDLSDGTRVLCDVLYAHPPQRHVELVRALGVALDDAGYVWTNPTTSETSVSGVYAAGDLTTRAQGAVLAAASGLHAASMLNAELTSECAVTPDGCRAVSKSNTTGVLQ